MRSQHCATWTARGDPVRSGDRLLSQCPAPIAFTERVLDSKNRVAFRSARPHFDALYPQLGHPFKGRYDHRCWSSPI